MMKKWKHLKGWQRGSIIGFSISGGGHILLLTIILFSGDIKGEGWLGILLLELPLVWMNHFFNLLLGIEIFPIFEGFIFWLWIYISGTIAWGVVGAVMGFIFGFLSDLSKAKEVRK